MQYDIASRRPRFARAMLLAAFCVATNVAFSQAQTNSPQGSLSINGTGHLESSVLLATNSQSASTPSSTAPAYTHRTAPLTSLELRVEGNPNRPFVLAIGTVAAAPLAIGAQRVELNLATIQTFIDGSAPGIYNSFANTGNSGSWSMVLPGGVPTNFPAYALQGAVFDPTVVSGIKITGTVALQTLNTIDTLNRNLLDAYFQSPRHPGYIASLLSSTFLVDGSNSSQFLGEVLSNLAIAPNQPYLVGVDYLGFGPSSPNAPPLPSGPPSAGQSAAQFLEFRERYYSPNVVLPSPLMARRSRSYWFHLKEQNGVWRLHGNQMPVEFFVQLKVSPASVPTAQNQGLDVRLNIHVEADGPAHGGIASVVCTGPHLGNVNVNNQSTSPASGSRQMTSSNGVFSINVELAATGTSTLPLVEIASGARDVYTINVTWSDSTTSGPFTVPLRCAIDIAASPALALAAIPGVMAPATTAALSQGGLYSATCAVNFTDGTFPVNVPLGELQLSVWGASSSTKIEGLVPSPGSAQSFTIRTPFLGPGSATIQLSRRDVHSTDFYKQTSITL